jgi:hypothetical protein
MDMKLFLFRNETTRGRGARTSARGKTELRKGVRFARYRANYRRPPPAPL